MLDVVLFVGVPIVGLVAFVIIAGLFFVKDRSFGGVLTGLACLLVAGVILLYLLFIHALGSMSSNVNLF